MIAAIIRCRVWVIPVFWGFSLGWLLRPWTVEISRFRRRHGRRRGGSQHSIAFVAVKAPLEIAARLMSVAIRLRECIGKCLRGTRTLRGNGLGPLAFWDRLPRNPLFHSPSVSGMSLEPLASLAGKSPRGYRFTWLVLAIHRSKWRLAPHGLGRDVAAQPVLPGGLPQLKL